MKEKFEQLLKINWWEWFPVLGTMAYGIRIELFLNNQEKAIRKAGKKYVGIYRLIGTVIGLSFLTAFFIIRNTKDYGAFPWPFWVGLSFGLSSNISPIILKPLYNKGFNRYLSTGN